MDAKQIPANSPNSRFGPTQNKTMKEGFEMEFTKKQQQRIDRCTGKLKEEWIKEFTYIQNLKKSPEYKQFMKSDREHEKQLSRQF